MQFTCYSISASFLKTNTGTDYVNDKKRSVLDSTPTVLLEQFTLFDDNKNNNQESVTILKERHQAGKSDLENDVNNYTKPIDHTLFTCGNFIVVKEINIYSVFSLKNPKTKLAGLPVPDFNFLRAIEGVNNSSGI